MSYKNTIKLINETKKIFESNLEKNLNLCKVCAPLIVNKKEEINDYLNGIDAPVSFNTKHYDLNLEIVQSLAKWKRHALQKYEFSLHEGILTDMKAVRSNEKLSNFHSFYVDQWDWEYIISENDRNIEFLKMIVNKIYKTIIMTKNEIDKIQGNLFNLADKVFFIDSQELENLYPNLSPKLREKEITRKYKSVFIMKIGDYLQSNIKHDERAPDYDDWKLNGDLLVWSDISDKEIELSSMGIRVDSISLINQLKKLDLMPTSNYHKKLIKNELPLTIGGGIGQSRLLMFLLAKKHISEVQAAVWDKNELENIHVNNYKDL